MHRRSKINILAFAAIAAGVAMLSTAKPAAAAAFDGCDRLIRYMLMIVPAQEPSCAAQGGSYSYSATCNLEGYTFESSYT